MDLNEFVNGFGSMTCVLSVEAKPEGGYGTIRIEAANKLYVDSLATMPNTAFENFKPGEEYVKYVPQSLNFESYCYKCAVEKRPLHAYVRVESLNLWLNVFMQPLNIESSNKFYCTFSQEFSKESDSGLLTNFSAEVTAGVLKICVKLHGAPYFKKAIDDCLTEIRNIFNAGYCSLMFTDFKNRRLSLFSEIIAQDTELKSMKGSVNDSLIDYATTWLDTLEGNSCIVVANSRDLETIKEKNPTWHRSLLLTKVKTMALFPLRHEKETIGFIWVADFNADSALTLKETLTLTSFFVASEIVSYRLRKKIEQNSVIDALTEVLNRNSMNDWVFRQIKSQNGNVAIAFAELVDLPKINKSEGYEVGDCLLKEAAFILRTSFEDCVIYRANGNLFAMIMPILDKTSTENFEKRISDLQEIYTTSENIRMSFGLECGSNNSDVRVVMHNAYANLLKKKQEMI